MIATLSAAITLLEACGGGGASPYVTPTLQAVQISPSTSLILLAGTRQLTATGIYSDGSSQNLTTQVTWSSSSTGGSTNFVSVNSKGVATGTAIGSSVVLATMGSVVGVLQLTVNTNGFASGTTAILNVPFKTTEVDAAYLPDSKNLIQGAYAVQEVNLDADQFSSVIPVPVALLASIPMPAGFVPNATAASQTSAKVAVISYSSADVQVIDASNDPTDLTNNSVIATFTAPISKKATFNGITCMICAAVVNPLNDLLVLSTAQGYYTMDFNSGAFTALPFTPTAFPAQNFAINPVAADPYILSPTYGQDPKFPSEVQVLDLNTHAVTTNTTVGLPTADAAAIDPLTNYAALVDASTNDQALVDATDIHNPVFSLVSNVGVCPGQPMRLDMVALGVSSSGSAAAAHTLFSSQTSGDCVGFQVWPNLVSQLDPSQILYAYGSMPATPDGNPFVNGNDPNAIAAFTSVVDKKNYGLLVDAKQNWIAKINFATVFSLANIGTGSPTLPAGQQLTAADLNANPTVGNTSIVFLPSPSTMVTLSAATVNFGNPNVGTSTPPVPITLSNISAASNIGSGLLNISQIVIQGSNASDFALTDNCISPLSPQSNCAITITFTPTAKGQRSATLSITDDGGASPQTVVLSGTGT
ncbi:MAG TPA: choice-of-anchor D domain-containing protein [Terriglobales bacterium]|nr:choice-of-anchor D domain-containing protein [Terriglobales bacterium]